MNKVHQAILKRASLGDTEGYHLLRGAYDDTPPEERANFLLEVVGLADEVRKRLKKLELEQLEVKEARIANVIEAAETAQTAQREDLRPEVAGGDDEASGEGGEPG